MPRARRPLLIAEARRFVLLNFSMSFFQVGSAMALFISAASLFWFAAPLAYVLWLAYPFLCQQWDSVFPSLNNAFFPTHVFYIIGLELFVWTLCCLLASRLLVHLILFFRRRRLESEASSKDSSDALARLRLARDLDESLPQTTPSPCSARSTRL